MSGSSGLGAGLAKASMHKAWRPSVLASLTCMYSKVETAIKGDPVDLIQMLKVHDGLSD